MPQDMRRSFDGLALATTQLLGQDPCRAFDLPLHDVPHLIAWRRSSAHELPAVNIVFCNGERSHTRGYGTQRSAFAAGVEALESTS
jgi:hypothetical protein